MDDLELLKQDWNENNKEFKIYNENDLFKIIRKNTSSISKKLLTIGLLEVFLWFFLLFLDKRDNEPFFNVKVIIRTILFFTFIVALIYYYHKINSGYNLKKLMKSILGLRKVILIYVGLVFISILIFTIIEAKEDTNDMVRGWTEGYNDAKSNYVDSQLKANDIEPSVAYFFYTIAMIVFLTILYFIYDHVYGGLLEKLKINFKELAKIEDSNA